MHIQAILNRVEKFKPFVNRRVTLKQADNLPVQVAEVLPRWNNRPVYAGCGQTGPVYDHLDKRRFEFVPL